MQSVSKKLAGISMLVVACAFLFALLFGRHIEITNIIASKGSSDGFFVTPSLYNYRIYTFIFMIALGGIACLLPINFEAKRSDFDTSVSMSPSAMFSVTLAGVALIILSAYALNRFIFDKGGALTLGQLYVAFTTIAALIGFKGLSDAIKKQERGGVLSLVAVIIGLAPYITVIFFRIIDGKWMFVF